MTRDTRLPSERRDVGKRRRTKGFIQTNLRAVNNLITSREMVSGLQPCRGGVWGSQGPRVEGVWPCPQGCEQGCPVLTPTSPSGISSAALWPRIVFLEVLNGLNWFADPAARELAAPWHQAAEEMEDRYLPGGWAGLSHTRWPRQRERSCYRAAIHRLCTHI